MSHNTKYEAKYYAYAKPLKNKCYLHTFVYVPKKILVGMLIGRTKKNTVYMELYFSKKLHFHLNIPNE
ncbi:hypothetical protein D0437_16180 [Bacillus cereus]|uniref:Uncharacterized protein n=1 Tax=Bacillus cereus TaxID=1396 RepID=A0A9X7QKT2_BACCE|nr:hypothetical protein D0437_16180 [Bacillus cereus]